VFFYFTALGRLGRALRIQSPPRRLSNMVPGGMLLSSPARMAHNNSPILIISSSPEFPSINDLVARPPKKPALRSGSNAAPIPENAIPSFTTAANLWRSARSDEETTDNPLGTQSCQTAPVPSRVSTTALEMPPEPAATQPLAAQAKQKRKPRATTKGKEARPSTFQPLETGSAVDPIGAEVVAAPEAKPARKRRTGKAAADGQTTLPKGKVTKPTARGKASVKRAEIASRHFSAEITLPDAAQPAAQSAAPKSIDNEPLELEMAPRRRIDWTPPPIDDHPRPVDSSSAIKEVSAPTTGRTQPHKDPRLSFKSLLDDYNHKVDGEQSREIVTPSVNLDVLGKRKLVQMVAAAAASVGGGKSKTPETSPTKTKLPKKKPRTITELATAAYRLPEESDTSASGGVQKDPLLDYFEAEKMGPADPTEAATAKTKKGAKKPAKPKVSKKKEDPRKQLLLSPTSAMKQVAGQDFVFGTASQLATEEDPELLRALHQAMLASNQPDDDPFCSSPVIAGFTMRRGAGNKLWAAGARDDDGGVRDLEILDLTGSPEIPRDYTLPPNPLEGSKHSQAHRQRIEIEIQSSDFDSPLSADPPPKSHFFATQAKVTESAQRTPPTASRKQHGIETDCTPETDFEPPPSNQEHNQLLVQSQSNSPAKPKEPEGPSRPKYELFTDAQLAREISSYGFKSVKKRTAMIALLDQCWASKTTATTSVGGMTIHATMATSSRQTAPASDVSAKSPTRPKGRPRKTSVPTGAVGAEAPQPVKRPRGRPKKDTAAVSPPKITKGKGKALAPVEVLPAPAAQQAQVPSPSTPRRRKAPAKEVLEIADSESDADPFGSSPMSSPEKMQDVLFSPSQSQMDVSITEDTEMSLVAMSPTVQQTTVFGYITKAVTTAPATKDPANPSWHEKMLMYDPVILEDLTAWLNAGQLDRVGYDGEVAPGDVKGWCESKSVCCLWRVNLHGKERKRF